MSIQEKQQYLRDNVMEAGYQPHDFEHYWQESGYDFESITIEQLEIITDEFKKLYHVKQKNQQQQFSDFQGPDAEMMKIDWGFLQIKRQPTHLNSNQPAYQIPQLNSSPNLKKGDQKKIDKPQINFLDFVSQKQMQREAEFHGGSKQDASREGLPQNSISIRDVYKQSTTQTHSCLKLQPNIIDHHNNVEINVQRVVQVQQEGNGEMARKEKGLITKLWEGAKTTIGFNQLPVWVKTTGRNKSKAIGMSWNVQRRRADFDWLHKTLVKLYPGIVVPPLPPIPRSEDKVFGYIKKLEAFLLDIYRCRQLRNSKYFENFLSYGRPDLDSFIAQSENHKEPSSLSHILNMQGSIDLYFGDKISEYAQNLNGYINKESSHLKQVKTVTSQIIEQYESLSLNFHVLGGIFDKMAQQTDAFSLARDSSPQEKCYNLLTQTYCQIASLMDKHSEFCLEQKALIQSFMLSHFSYEKDRLQNMTNLLSKRSTFSQAFKRLQKLQQDKQKEQKKTSLFGLNKLANLFSSKEESLETPSNNFEVLKKQTGFYNSQVLKETTRCIDVMIQSYVTHFSSYGHRRVDNVDSMQQVWSKVMVQFSKIRVI